MQKRKPKCNVVIWGAGGHAKVVADVIELRDDCNVLGFFEDDENLSDRDFLLGKKVFKGARSLEDAKDQGATSIIFGFGSCRGRIKNIPFLDQCGLKTVSAIHPKSVIANDVVIEEGNAVMGGSVVNPGTTIGKHSIINTGCTIDHDCIVGSVIHAGPGVHVGGSVSIGDGTWLGIGALIGDGLSIGKDVVVGAGSVVIHDLPDSVVAYGCPAKIIRRLKSD